MRLTRRHRALLHQGDDLARLHKGTYGVALGFDSLAPALLTVDQRQHTSDRGSSTTNRVDRFQRRAATRNNVFYDHHSITGSKRAFNQLASAVGLGFLPDGECTQRCSRQRAGVCDGVRHGIGSEGKTANRIRAPVRGDQLGEPQRADQDETLGAHRRHPGVDIQARAYARGKCKFTKAR